jgi:membrane protein required for colicin V production
MIAGFLLASWFGGMAAGALMPYVSSKAAASIFGYLLVFIGVVILGGIIATVIARMLKLIGLSWMDRLLGGAFGAVRGFVMIAIVTMVVSALAPKWIPEAVNRSTLAPYVLRTSRVLTELTPFDIRDGFRQAYADFQKLKLGK